MSLVAHDEATQAGSILFGPADSRGPDWFRDQQRAAWKQFESLPKPTRKDQAWRFANVDRLDLTPFKFGGTLSDDDRVADGPALVSRFFVYSGQNLDLRKVTPHERQ